MVIVGLDAASNPKKFGYAIALQQGGNATLVEHGLLQGEGHRREVLERIAKEIRKGRALICIDAPLGWPRQFGDVLKRHMAGDVIHLEKNTFFRRHTDEFIGTNGKWPLEIAADKIARAAHEALHTLNELRSLSGLNLELAWEHKVRRPSVIEVYPAATLKAHEIASDYRRNNETRDVLRTFLAERMSNLPDLNALDEDTLDAIMCVWAGLDFLNGDCIAPLPRDLPKARKEGWIWVHRKFAGQHQ